ncbi:MAG TPA: hypothetical protein VN622_02475 [Clostridia bacterium]|nr:hypothetical protein [Clostridia bacterium]
MNFALKLLRGISFVPAVVHGIEALFGSKSGNEKKEAALSFVGSALSMTEAVASREIVDEDRFRSGLGKIIDGVVECLNASAWAKAK